MLPILLEAKGLERIAYADKPLPQLTDGDRIAYLTREEFQQKFNTQYSESLHGNQSDVLPVLNNSLLLQKLAAGRADTPSESAIIDRFNTPLDGLVICYIGPEVGYGLFTSQPIRAKTVLFMYAGELAEPTPYTPERNSDYAWLPGAENNRAINAAKVGGLARFMQHLPMDYSKHAAMLENQLNEHVATNPLYAMMLKQKNMTISKFVEEMLEPYKKEDEVGGLHFQRSSLKEGLVTSNMKLCTVVVKGMPVVVVLAEEDIAPNTQLGFSYGKNYWLTAHMQPRYFYSDGSLVPLSVYRNAFYAELNRAQPLLSGVMQTDPRRLYDQAIVLYKEKNFIAAIQKLDLAIKAYEGRPQELASCYDTLASCYRDNEEIERAIEVCKTALDLRQNLLLTNESIRPAFLKTSNKLAQLEEKLRQKLTHK